MRQATGTLLAMLLLPALALAQGTSFPDRPLRIIVPFTAGSGSDSASRFFGEKLAVELGQPVVVENRPGASGVIAVSATRSAPADGYTLLLASISILSVNPVMVKDLPYDPVKDLRPISGLTQVTSVFVVPATSKLRTLADLVAAAKASPKELTSGSYSAGYDLAVKWFAGLAGVRFANVPYKGAAAIFTDLMGDRLDFAIADLGGAAPLIKAGRLRALAVSRETRDALLPDVPTFVESGYPEYINRPWISFYARAETPEDVTNRLAQAMQSILATKAARDYAQQSAGNDLMPLGPEAMRRHHLAEIERFRQVARNAGVTPQ